MPARGDIRPSDFPRLLPSISLVDVCREEGRFRVRLAGTGLRDVYEGEITGSYLDELNWGDKRDYWLAAYQRVVDDGRPAQGIVRAPCQNQDHLVQFWLRLPLASESSSVSMILCYDVFIPAIKVPEMMSHDTALQQASHA